jgi:hypothetical protein
MPITRLIAAQAQRATDLAKLFKYGGLKAVLKHLENSRAGHTEVLCTCPNVILVTASRPRDEIHLRLADMDVIFLLRFPWELQSEAITSVACQIEKESFLFPNHKFMALCNEQWQVPRFTELGIDAVFVGSNSFVNESSFYPVINETFEYAAVYNAALAPYKRFELASKIKTLMVITYKSPVLHEDSYETMIRNLLSSAYWANDSLVDSQKLRPDELPSLYGKCGVGLCLSGVEGQMFASIEYLLCGLPVVTTYSRGGRDVFFDDRYVRTVAPDPDAVAQAVDELNRMNIDRHMIREATILKIREHRERFSQALKKYEATVKMPWRPGSHGAVTFRSHKEVEKLVRSGSRTV